MNDRSEFRQATEYAMEEMKPYLRMPSQETGTVMEFARAYAAGQASVEFAPEEDQPIRVRDIYVFSLSGKCDDLNQWRAYCAGGGYALGFARSSLEAFAAAHEAHLFRCLYGRGEYANWFHEEFRKHEDRMTKQLPQYDADAYKDWTADMKGSLLGDDGYQLGMAIRLHLPAVKHPRFREEEEWRLVFSDWSGTPGPEFFREARGGLVPHVRIACCELPIASVWIGPTQDKHSEKLAVEKLLRRYRPKEMIPVSTSEIPYRG